MTDEELFSSASNGLDRLIRELDEARAYGVEARIRENKAEDARVSASFRAERAEADVERLRGLLGDARIYVQQAGFRTSSALLARINAELAEGVDPKLDTRKSAEDATRDRGKRMKPKPGAPAGGYPLSYGRHAMTNEQRAALEDQIAEALWHRYAPSHHIAWADEPHRAEYTEPAAEILAALATKAAPVGTFRLGDRVRKVRGSSWQGRVVGTYSTTLTPEGYCVESEREPGSVQIYPATALERVENKL